MALQTNGRRSAEIACTSGSLLEGPEHRELSAVPRRAAGDVCELLALNGR